MVMVHDFSMFDYRVYLCIFVGKGDISNAS